MSDDSVQSTGATTSVSLVINAPRPRVYQSFLSGDTVASWLAPDNMRATVHRFEPRPGGDIRISLTYQNLEETPDGMGGKSAPDTDTFRGTFVELVPDEKIVWLTEFESPDPAFSGTMTLIWSLADADGGTEVTVRCENIPRGVRPEDNEAGSRSTLEKLAAFLE